MKPALLAIMIAILGLISATLAVAKTIFEYIILKP